MLAIWFQLLLAPWLVWLEALRSIDRQTARIGHQAPHVRDRLRLVIGGKA